MNFLWAVLLFGVMIVGAVGYLITLFGQPTRRLLKARKVFFWVMVAPAALILLLALWTKAARHGR